MQRSLVGYSLDKAARSIALNNMHHNYSAATCTVVHDLYLAGIEWKNGRMTGALALHLSYHHGLQEGGPLLSYSYPRGSSFYSGRVMDTHSKTWIKRYLHNTDFCIRMHTGSPQMLGNVCGMPVIVLRAPAIFYQHYEHDTLLSVYPSPCRN